MFEDSLFESGQAVKTHRGATTAASAALQVMLLGSTVLASMIYTEALPRTQALALSLPSPPRGAPPDARPAERHRPQGAFRSEVLDRTLLVPIAIPTHPAEIHDEPLSGDLRPESSGPYVPGATGTGTSGIPESVLNSGMPVRPHFEAPSRVVMGGDVTSGHLIRRVEPIYPELAIRARIQGDVILHAVISRDGSIQNLSLVSGHPMLAQAALDAVRSWRYQPFLLNGQTIEVATEVTVRFRLGR